MKERPVLFSGPMIRALLREVDPKTMTRRVMNPQPGNVKNYAPAGQWGEHPCDWIFTAGELPTGQNTTGFELIRCPYGVPGDRLWVRETLGVVANWGSIHYVADNAVCYDPDDQKAGFPYVAEAQAIVERYGDSYHANDQKCVPSIFMPRWASRITLEITDVKAERVQDISEADAIAEGIERTHDPEGWKDYRPGYQGSVWKPEFPIDSFRSLWDSINSARGHGWDTNPWVWAITFKRILQ